jgi:hypothetical protein
MSNGRSNESPLGYMIIPSKHLAGHGISGVLAALVSYICPRDSIALQQASWMGWVIVTKRFEET